MGVMPAVRGRGIGTRLIESAIAQAWTNGLMRIELTVRTDNEAATKLYERVGSGMRAGCEVPCLLMASSTTLMPWRCCTT